MRRLLVARVTVMDVTTDLPVVSQLFLEYKASLKEFDAEFWTTADKEVGSLPGRYSPQLRGSILLARLEPPPFTTTKTTVTTKTTTTNEDSPRPMSGDVVGCVALHRLDEETCELKRLYVRSEARGYGVGKALMFKAIEVARGLNYSRVNINTLSRLTAAIALYRSFGFQTTEPYCTDTTSDAQWMQLTLPPSPSPSPLQLEEQH